MLEWLKRLIAAKELAELERWRVYTTQYRQWLAGSPSISAMLDNLEAEVRGTETPGHNPHAKHGALGISRLREMLQGLS